MDGMQQLCSKTLRSKSFRKHTVQVLATSRDVFRVSFQRCCTPLSRVIYVEQRETAQKTMRRQDRHDDYCKWTDRQALEMLGCRGWSELRGACCPVPAGRKDEQS
nr:hypothetical protein CFP56_33629 [Quercus suber]